MTLNINRLSPLHKEKNTLRFILMQSNMCLLNIGYNIIIFELVDFYLEYEK